MTISGTSACYLPFAGRLGLLLAPASVRTGGAVWIAGVLRSPLHHQHLARATSLASPLLRHLEPTGAAAVCQPRVLPAGRWIQLAGHIVCRLGSLSLSYQLPLPDIGLQRAGVCAAASHHLATFAAGHTKGE